MRNIAYDYFLGQTLSKIYLLVTDYDAFLFTVFIQKSFNTKSFDEYKHPFLQVDRNATQNSSLIHEDKMWYHFLNT